jgi:hypothetical protein
MSHDLVAVQRDAALLDALAERAWVADPLTDHDPVAGLLAALAADVDEGLSDVARPAAIPAQRHRENRRATVLTLPVALPPVGRRHAVRAAAAMIVSAALLSVSGVAAAVSGDPMTPYERVVDVVRISYHEVLPRKVVAPKPTGTPAAATVVAARAEQAAEQARSALGGRASRSVSDRRFWNRQMGVPGAWHRTGSDHQRLARQQRYGQSWGGRQRSGGGGFGAAPSGQGRTGYAGSGSGDVRAGGAGYGGSGYGGAGYGVGGSGYDGWDSGAHGGRSGGGRR